MSARSDKGSNESDDRAPITAVIIVVPVGGPGTQRGSPGRSAVLGFIGLVVALVLAGLAIRTYIWLRDWHPPAVLNATVRDAAALQHLTLTSGDGRPQVRWQVSSGIVRQLTVNGPGQGTAEIVLPLSSACGKIMRALGPGASCINTGRSKSKSLLVQSPPQVEFSWPEGQLPSVSSFGYQHAVSLDLAFPGSSRASPSVTLTASGSRPPILCFSSPTLRTTLMITYGSRRPYTYPFPRTPAPMRPCQGLVVLIESGTPGQLPPPIGFAGIQKLALDACAPGADTEGFAGQITLTPGGTKVVAVPAMVLLTARPGDPIGASLDIEAGGQAQGLPPASCLRSSGSEAGRGGPAQGPVLCPPAQLCVRSQAATSVLTASGELVPSQWARNPGIAVPMLGGMITAAVALVGVAVQTLMDALKEARLPGWIRRRARRHPEQKEERDAD